MLKKILIILLFLLSSVPASQIPCEAEVFAQVDTAWVRTYNGPGNGEDYARAIAADDSGYVYVTGSSWGSGSNYDYATIKYYPNGDTAWVRRYNGPENLRDETYAIAVGGSGNVYVTGYSGSYPNSNYATIKYYPNGDTAWVRRYNGPGDDLDEAHAIVVDDSGYVYVTGRSVGSGTDEDYATIKYYPDGDTVWVRRYNGPGNGWDQANAVAVDGSGNVYVTGWSYDGGTYLDYATIKYCPDGEVAWVHRYDGSGKGNDWAYALAVDSNRNVYVTGACYADTFAWRYEYTTLKYYPDGTLAWASCHDGGVNGGRVQVAVDIAQNAYFGGSRNGYCVIKYDSLGNPIWQRCGTGSTMLADSVQALCLDSSGNVYITGVCFDSGYMPVYCATIKYSSDGDTCWIARYPELLTGWASGQALAVDVGGNVYVGGLRWDEKSSGADYLTIKYVQWQPDLIANFSASPESGVVACTVQFTDLSSGNPISWFWDFGDGNTDTLQNPTHTYDDTGYFDVKLVVSNETNVDSLIKEDYIHVFVSIPVLSWADQPGYLTDGVSPDTGLTGTLFTYRVVYSDSNNSPPQTGYPKVNIDLNGDGDFEDENEGSFTMGVVDVDTDYVDGREYFYNAILPASSNCQYSFSAKNSYGLDAVGEPTNLKAGPVILDPDSTLDLYIHASDITFSDPNPDEGDTFTVFATVHNNSDSNLTNVSVTFYHSGELLDQVLLSSVPSHGSATASIELSFDTEGFYPIRVVVDEENSFEEWNELNNFAMRPITVGDYQFPGGIVVQAQLNSPVYPYSWITVTGNAHYTPEHLGVVSGATVTITIQETEVQYTTYTNDPGNFSVGFYGPSEVGSYSVIVEVTDYTLTDSTILNLDVLPHQSGVDLTISINMSQTDCLSENQEVAVETKIFNWGDLDAQNFWTCIYKDASLYQSYWVDQLLAGDSLQIDTVISFSSIGRHTVTGYVDAGDSVNEYNEGNNISLVSGYVACNGSDITIRNVIFSDHTPQGGQAIDITAWVVNLGALAVTETFGVEFSDNGIPFDTQYVSSLAPCGTQTAYVVSDSFVYSDTMQHSFSIFADFENVIGECDEENNIYTATISTLPDLWPRNLEFSQDCFTWGDSLWFQVDIYNIGQQTAESVWVSFLLDDVPVGEDVLIDSIPSGSGNYETRLSEEPWIVPEELDVTHVCRVVVDPYSEILEIREDNNEITRATPVVRCGDVTQDCVVNIADVVYLINYLFIGGPAPFPFPAADVNIDGKVDIADVVYLINYLFIGGPPPCG